MAQVQISAPLDMDALDTWYGNVVGYNATQIIIANGPLSIVYTGNFSYDAQGDVSGTLTGVTESFSGQVQFAATELDVPANTAEQLIESDQIPYLLNLALSGNDQFSISGGGNHVINGYAGDNTVSEPLAFSDYTITTSGGSVALSDGSSQDILQNIQGIYFPGGYYDVASATYTPGLAVQDTTTGQAVQASGTEYSGPVAGLQHQYINVTADSINVAVSSPNWFIHTGSGNDAIAAYGGTNVLDGGTGSNFLVGGSGADTFFVDDRNAPADIWSTVSGFHAGDAATIWGVTPQDFSLNWADNQGANGYTGLTLHATAAGKANASLTLAGYSTADLSNGRLSVMFGTDPASGSTYMYVHGNS